MIRNQSGQTAGAQVNNATTGAPFSGAVTCFVIGDGGTRTIGSVGGGAATDEGGGYYTYQPSAAETNFESVAFQFVGTGAISSATTYETITAEQQAALAVASGGGGITCRELLLTALRRIGVVAQGITVQPETLAQALTAFNAFVDGLAANRLMLYGETRTTWPLVSGQQQYLVGPGQDVDIARPVFVEQQGNVSPIRYLDTANSSLEVPLTFLNEQQWRAVSLKALTGTLPSCAFYNPTFPYATIDLWQVPTSSTLQGVLYAPTAMVEFDYADVISLPPGYRRFLITNLALELCAEFERPVPPSLQALAKQAMADVERVNMRLTDMAVDPMWAGGGAGVYNIFSDTPTR